MRKQSILKNIKGICFDVGDTLIGAHPLMMSGVSYASKELFTRKMISEEGSLIKHFFQADASTYFPHINHLFSHISVIEKALQTSKTLNTSVRLNVMAISAVFLAYYRCKIRELICIDSELIDLFVKLKTLGLKLGVISNGTTEEQIEVLVRLGVADLFDDILISEEIDSEKPNLDIFKLSAHRLELEPKNLVFIGDSLDDDITPALSAGFHAILSRQFKKIETSNLNNITVINNIQEILNLIKFI
jgi:putative hydrolase of the HAD superfamily